MHTGKVLLWLTLHGHKTAAKLVLWLFIQYHKNLLPSFSFQKRVIHSQKLTAYGIRCYDFTENARTKMQKNAIRCYEKLSVLRA